MGGWEMRAHTKEQQARLHIDEVGKPTNSHPKDCYFDRACHALVDWAQISQVKQRVFTRLKELKKNNSPEGVQPVLTRAHQAFRKAGMPEERIDYILTKWAKGVYPDSLVASTPKD